MSKWIWGIGALALASALPAQAAITIKANQSATPSENVQFNDGLPNNVSPLRALTNKGTEVTFVGTEMLRSNGGQARLSGAGGTINFLEFYLTDLTQGITTAEFLLTDINNQSLTTATITAFDQFGAQTVFSSDTTTGNDWFSLFTSENSIISKIRITTADPIGDVRQVRLTAATIPTTPVDVVPEPATWAMMIIGFGLTGTMVRRRKTLLANQAA